MRLREEFWTPHDAKELWRLFEDAELVAKCMPGVELAQAIDKDTLLVRATQRIGPLSATFEAKVTVLERTEYESIRFRAIGRSIAGAVGNVRIENLVRLCSFNDGTNVVIEGDVILAGALGSVGQKVVAQQSRRVLDEFASNLQRAISGEEPSRAVTAETPKLSPGTKTLDAARSFFRGEGGWRRTAFVVSVVALVISIGRLLSKHRRLRDE